MNVTSHPVAFFTFKNSGNDPCVSAKDYLDFLTLFTENGVVEDLFDKIPDNSRRCLQDGWPHAFRTLVPAMVEEVYELKRGGSQGVSNSALPMMISLSILKEVWELTDEALENAVRFDLRFQYALGLKVDETDWSLDVLNRFRKQVLFSSEVMWIFDKVVTRTLAQLDSVCHRPGLDTSRIRFNMMMQLRLSGLVETLEAFLKGLEVVEPIHFQSLPRLFTERYGKRPGAFASVRPDQCRRQWDQARHDVKTMITRFDSEESIHSMMLFQALKHNLGEPFGVQMGRLLPVQGPQVRKI
ncbi:MAG: transposase [Magnetococcales bacterium]|nr:transposase [Magnetococcales bacterium]